MKVHYFHDLSSAWIVLFSPYFFQSHINSLGSLGAKLFQQSRAWFPCGSSVGHPTSPQGIGDSFQLLPQPLIPALVNPGNAHREQLE